MLDQRDAQERLQELLSALQRCRGDLELAELNGFEFVAASARREIHRQHELVRRHCTALGLPLPPELMLHSE